MTTDTANRDPLIAVADATRAYFQTLPVPVDVVVGVVGTAQRDRNDNIAPGGAGRILFIEPDELGTFQRARSNSSIGVNIGLDLAFLISVWAADPTNTQSEQRQREATYSLLELLFQALRRLVDPVTKQPIGYGGFHFGKLKRGQAATQSIYFGRELLVDVTLDTYLADIAPQRGVGQVGSIAGTFSKGPVTKDPPPAIPNLTGGN